MGILKEFERSLEGSVEGFFGRVFRSRLQPLELAKALERYADDHRLVSSDGTIVQNVYEFTVGAKDHERLDAMGTQLVDGLAEVVRRNAEARRHRLAGPVVVRLRRDDAVRVGMFELAGRVDARVPARRAGARTSTPAPALPASEQLFGSGARSTDHTSPDTPAAAYGANGVPPLADPAVRPDADPAPASSPFAPRVEDPDAAAIAEDLDTPPAWARRPAPGLPAEPPPFSLDPPGAEAPLFIPPPPAGPPPTPAHPGVATDRGPAGAPEHEQGLATPRPVPAADRSRELPSEADPAAVDGRSDAAHRGGAEDGEGSSEQGGDEAPAVEALAPPRTRLVVRTAGASNEASIELVGGRLLVGRHRNCDLRLDDTTVSREHATFVRRGPTWWVLDMGSTNGTTVNGVGAAEQALSDGDVVAVGDVELLFAEA